MNRVDLLGLEGNHFLGHPQVTQDPGSTENLYEEVARQLPKT